VSGFAFAVAQRSHLFNAVDAKEVTSLAAVRKGPRMSSATMRTISVSGLLLLAMALAGCQTNGVQYPGYMSTMTQHTGYVVRPGHAKTAKYHRSKARKHVARRHHRARVAKRAKPAQAAATTTTTTTTNRAALGLTLLGEPQRIVVFQDRLRGLCEVTKIEQISSDSWRASCTKGDAFIIKVYSDGFMTVTRS
jgi:hypothetical protein